ncbi:MAG TPA: WG repeat-containing protein [Bryobacteraceae bacterium]
MSLKNSNRSSSQASRSLKIEYFAEPHAIVGAIAVARAIAPGRRTPQRCKVRLAMPRLCLSILLLPLVLFLSANWIFACSSIQFSLWAPSSDSNDELYRFIQKGRAGFIDRSGRVVIPPTLPIVDEGFSNGILVYRDWYRGEDVAAIDTRGRVLFGAKTGKVRYTGPFHDGLAVASLEDRRLEGFIDRHGDLAIPLTFPQYPRGVVHSFSDGLADIEVEGRVGYMDPKGNFVIAQQFVAGMPFSEGYAAVVDSGPCLYKNWGRLEGCAALDVLTAPITLNPSKAGLSWCHWKFIDKSGHRAFQGEFEGAIGFSEGLAAVKVKEKWGYIDARGNDVIAPSFPFAASFSDGLALVRTEEGHYGFINRSGRIQIALRDSPPLASAAFGEGVLPVRDAGRKWIFLGKDGKQAVPGRYQLATGFFHGRAHVQIDGQPGGTGRYGYINRQGAVVFAYNFEPIVR